ncbi:MAG TPA: SGNH/GDSL hydrolase family protein [Gemmatimonadaceae bacterium]|nr:SGNH/GDSL hydrolase family protein [Gemmatimonadaceae bacterium]
MNHLVLLGDSIFDNAAYVRGGPDVVAQLRPLLPGGWQATLLAVDGAVTTGVVAQLQRLPSDATHLVLSVGGNDALGHVGLLDRRTTGSAQVLGWLADAAEEFAGRYWKTMTAVLALRLPTVVCTIYEGSFPDEQMQRLAGTALMVFNDAIVRAAIRGRVDLIDLRSVCDDPGDYANPIEPSVQGGAKIARAIVTAVTESGGSRWHTRVVGG